MDTNQQSFSTNIHHMKTHFSTHPCARSNEETFLSSDKKSKNPILLWLFVTILIYSYPCAAQFGGALNFDGINDFITINDAPSLDMNGDSTLTIEFWFRTTDTGAQRIVSKFQGNPNHTGYGVALYSDGSIGAAKVSTLANYSQITSTGVNYSDGLWHHFAVVMPGTNATNYQMFIDCNLASVVVSSNTLSASIMNDVNLTLGTDISNADFFSGDLDEVKIWNVARTLSNIQSGMLAPGNPAESGLVAYFDLNDGVPLSTNSTTSASDQSPFTNNGTLVNFNLTGPQSNWTGGAPSVDCNPSICADPSACNFGSIYPCCYNQCVLLTIVNQNPTSNVGISCTMFGPDGLIEEQMMTNGLNTQTFEFCVDECDSISFSVNGVGSGIGITWSYSVAAVSSGIYTGYVSSLPFMLGIPGCLDPFATNFNPMSTCDDCSCCYDNHVHIDLFDSVGDGWGDISFTVFDIDNLVTVASGTLASGDIGTEELCLPCGNYSFQIQNGSVPELSEISFVVFIDGYPVYTFDFGNIVPQSSAPIEICRGCTSPAASNFNPQATVDDDTCIFCPQGEFAFEFDLYSEGCGWCGATYYVVDCATSNVVAIGTLENAKHKRMSFCLPVGCYNVFVGTGNCDELLSWELNAIDQSFNRILIASGVANVEVAFSAGGAVCSAGCTDPSACNFTAIATCDDGSCCYWNCASIKMHSWSGAGWAGTYYTLANSNNDILYSGTLSGGALSLDQWCLECDSYNLVMNGSVVSLDIYWEICVNNQVIASGGSNSNEQFSIGNPPTNDHCTNAIMLQCGDVVSGSTSCSDTDSVSDCCWNNSLSDNGVWYTFIGTGDIFTLSTLATTTNMDSQIRVFTGDCGALECIGGNDDLPGTLLSSICITTIPGEYYYVLISDYYIGTNHDIGNCFTLSVACSSVFDPVPPNDSPAGSIELIAGGFTQNINYANPDCTPCSNFYTAYGVWFHVNVPSAGFNVSLISINQLIGMQVTSMMGPTYCVPVNSSVSLTQGFYSILVYTTECPAYGDVEISGAPGSGIMPTLNLGDFTLLTTSLEMGCTDPSACNFDPTAFLDNGLCEYPGCTDPNATNYNPAAGCEDGSCEFPCVGDFDLNGTVNTGDLLLMVGAFGCLSTCDPFDLDHNGVVNTSDLLLFMGVFGQPCP